MNVGLDLKISFYLLFLSHQDAERRTRMRKLPPSSILRSPREEWPGQRTVTKTGTETSKKGTCPARATRSSSTGARPKMVSKSK